MVRIKTGLRARDFNIESALEDPLDFTPEFSGFDDQMLIKRLQMRQEQLASHMKHPPPSALPETEAGADLLDRYNLQGNKHLVGVILDDPLFAVRHATAQIRHCATYLQTLNALVPYHIYGRYAQVLYSILDGPLSSLKSEIDLPKLHEAVFEQDRKTCRSQLTTHLVRLAGLLDKKLTTVLLDWTHRHDEALLEPYSLLTEALNACAQLPAKADAMFTGKELPALRKMIDTLVQGILRAEHPLGALLLANSAGQLPEPVKRLQTLSDKNLPPAPEAMGLSTLMLSAQIMGEVDWASAGKSFAYFMGDLLDILGASVVAQLSRLAQDAQNIKLDRVFAPSFKTLSALSRKLVGVQLTTFGDAMDQGFTVIGVQGGGLSNGLTQTERAELTRKNYRYASLHSLDGEKLGSTSAKGSYTNQPLVRNLTVIAAPSDHPELSRYSRFRAGLSQAGKALEKTRAVPTLMLGFAVYNLVVQLENYKTHESFRDGFGVISAFLDLGAAIGSHSKLFFGMTTASFLNTPRINIAKISIRWASNLEKQTGSPKLPLLRAIGGIATGAGALLSILDAFKSLEKGRYAQSAAYFATALGSGIWAAYALGLTINPLALLIGVAVTIGGSIIANLLSDSDIKLLTRNGPFGLKFSGNQTSFAENNKNLIHLNDPLIAYHQLVGLLGKPTITSMRLKNWRNEATAEQLNAIAVADTQRMQLIHANGYSQTTRPERQPLKNYDWVVIINSPLLSMFGNQGQQFQLAGEEFCSSLDTGQAFAIRQYRRQTTGLPKLVNVSMGVNSMLYVLPSFFQTPMLNVQQRNRFRVTEGLKVSLQVELRAEPNSPSLILPQPAPESWKSFSPNHRRLPPNGATADEAPLYWQIETNEHAI